MKKMKQGTRRMLSLAAALVMTLAMASAASASQSSDGLKECHTQHDESCGYSETMAGSGCTHVHDADCGYSEGTEGSPCQYVPDVNINTAAEATEHIHDDTCGYEEAIPAGVCSHVHDDACGYTETVVVVSPCQHECDICTPQDTTQSVECDCETLCTEESVNADCPVCRDNYEDCAAEAAAPAFFALAAGNGYSFDDITQTLTITTEDGLTSWRNDATFNQNNVTMIVIGDSVTTLGADAFQGCANLLHVTVGSGVTSMGTNTFTGANRLKTVLMKPINPPTLASNTFASGTPTESIMVPDDSLMTYKGAANWINKQDIIITAPFSGGSGTESDPYLITTDNDLKELAGYVNATINPKDYLDTFFKMTNDIDLKGSSSNLFPGIGSENNVFAGTFDGNGHQILHLVIDKQSDTHVGLFGYLSYYGTVKNLGIASGNIKGGKYTGALAGYNEGTIENCYNIAATVNGTDAEAFGGLTGMNSGTITSCYNSASVTASGDNVGGLTGFNSDGKIKHCYNTGKITTTGKAAGGIAGNQIMTDAVVQYCYNMGDVKAKENSGGIIGMLDEGQIKNCISLGKKVTVTETADTRVICGRVVGNENVNSSTDWSSLYARGDMSIGKDGEEAVTSSHSAIDQHNGLILSVDEAKANLQSQVFTGFNPENQDPIWIISSEALIPGSKLPKLKALEDFAVAKGRTYSAPVLWGDVTEDNKPNNNNNNSQTGNTSSSSSSNDTISYSHQSLPKNYKGKTKVIHNVLVPEYVVEGTWKIGENGKWRLAAPSGKDYAGAWVPAYNPYAKYQSGQPAFSWFLFDKDGNLVTGWHTDEQGVTYYLNPNSDNTQGSMLTGWQVIDGKNYYFHEEADGSRGAMYRDTITPDGYYVDSNGVWDGKSN